MKASELIEHLKSYIDLTGGDCEMLVFDRQKVVLIVLRILLRMVIMYFYAFHLINVSQRNQYIINNEC